MALLPFTVNTDGLAAGTYFVRVRNYTGSTFAPYILTDSLFTPAEANDAEINNTPAQAVPLAVNNTIKGHIGYYNNLKRDSSDWFKIVTPADGLLKLKVNPVNGQYINAALFDSDGKTIIKQASGNVPFVVSTDGLGAGNFFVKINGYYQYSYTPYSLTDSLYSPAEANDAELNNTAASALPLTLNSSSTGHLGYLSNLKRDTADWYKITTNEDGMLQLKVTPVNKQFVRASIYDNNAKTLIKSASDASPFYVKQDGLAAGTYYVKLDVYYQNSFAPYVITDSLIKYNYVNDLETNNKPYQAKSIPSTGRVTGHAGFYYNSARDSADWWKVDYNGTTGTLKFAFNLENKKMDGNIHYANVSVYRDTTKPALITSAFNKATNGVKVAAYRGIYYIKVWPYYSNEFVSYQIIDSNTAAPAAKIVTNQSVSVSDCYSYNSIEYLCSGGTAPYGVQLYRYGQPYGNPLQAGTTPVNFANLPLGSYYARAYSYGATGSNYGTSTTINILPTPSNLSAVINSGSTVTLLWTGYSCVKYYKVQYRDKIVGSWATRYTNGNIQNITINNLISNNTYRFQVLAVDSANNIIAEGKWSTIAEFTTTPATQTQRSITAANEFAEAKGQDIIKIYPNPVSDHLRVQTALLSEALTVSLVDINSKTVWQGISGSLKNTRLDIDVRNFPAGIYFLKVVTRNSHSFTKKIVISR